MILTMPVSCFAGGIGAEKAEVCAAVGEVVIEYVEGNNKASSSHNALGT
jgi:hypothetical protein